MSDDAADGGDGVAVDHLLDGRLTLHQYRKGHRVGTDAVLLAAAAGIEPGDSFIDVGAGAGAVGLMLALGEPESTGVLLDNVEAAVSLARRNIDANALERQVRAVCLDVLDGAAVKRSGLNASLVVTNPPFYLPGSVRPSTVQARSAAHVLSVGGHSEWVTRACDLIGPKGRLVMIHRPDALSDLLPALARTLGDIAVRPVHAKADAPAIRVVIAARANSKAPLSLAAPLVLHNQDGSFTPEAAELHRGVSGCFWAKKNRPRRAGSW